MFQENSIETCILSRVKQITSPGWMHRQALGPGALGSPAPFFKSLLSIITLVTVSLLVKALGGKTKMNST